MAKTGTAPKRAARRPSAAERNAAIWAGLNDRQQLFVQTIYDEDQAAEAEVKSARARGEWDSRPAAEWRAIDAFHDSGSKRLTTDLQKRWSRVGEHNEGNGATLKVLEDAGLITLGERKIPRYDGYMHTVTITTLGRAVLRAGTGLSGSGPKLLLGQRATEVLGELYAAQDSPAGTLDWIHSPTIERALIDRAKDKTGEPFAQHARPGYRITEAGALYYRENYHRLQDAFPGTELHTPREVRLDEGPDWTPGADELLDRFAHGVTGLLWHRDQIREDLARAERDAAAGPGPQQAPAPEPSRTVPRTLVELLGSELAELRARHGTQTAALLAEHRGAEARLRAGHARAEAEMLRVQLDRVEAGFEPALAAYVAVVLAAFGALVARREITAAIEKAADAEHRLDAPDALPETGVLDLDLTVAKLRATWAKPPKPRAAGRGRRVRPFTGLESGGIPNELIATTYEAPYVLARLLHQAMDGGVLHRQIAALRRKADAAADPHPGSAAA